jgi:hypothetical protein
VTTVLRNTAIIAAELERRRQEGPEPALLADRDTTQRHLATLEKQQAKLVRAFRETDATLAPWELIQRELAQIEQEKGRLHTTLADIEQRLDAEQATVDQLQSVTAYCQRAGHNQDTFDFAKKRLAFAALDVKVIANGREWRLTGWGSSKSAFLRKRAWT